MVHLQEYIRDPDLFDPKPVYIPEPDGAIWGQKQVSRARWYLLQAYGPSYHQQAECWLQSHKCHLTNFIHDDVINVYIFRVTGPLRGESTGHHWIPLTKPVTRSFDVFFYLRLYKRLSKQSRRRWFETPSRSLRRHCNVAFGDFKSPSWIRGGHSWWPTRSSWWTRWRHSRWPTRSIEISRVITQPINITHAPSPPFKVTRYRLT